MMFSKMFGCKRMLEKTLFVNKLTIIICVTSLVKLKLSSQHVEHCATFTPAWVLTWFSVFFYIAQWLLHSFFWLDTAQDSIKLTVEHRSQFLTLRTQTIQLFLCSIPFTIQRLCELLTDPRRNYTGTDKFLRGVEKVCILSHKVK